MKLQILAERAIDGDQDTLGYLQLDETTVVGSENEAVTWETICSHYHYCAHVFIVAVKLALDTLHKTSHNALRHMNWITRHHYRREFPSIPTTSTIKNLASIMSIVLKDVPPHHLNRSKDFNSQTSPEEETQVEPSPKEPKKPIGKNEKTNKKRRNGGDPEPPREDLVLHTQLRSHGVRHQTPS